jgi:hypothetical protein
VNVVGGTMGGGSCCDGTKPSNSLQAANAAALLSNGSPIIHQKASKQHTG